MRRINEDVFVKWLCEDKTEGESVRGWIKTVEGRGWWKKG